MRNLENFCHDVRALEALYNEVKDRSDVLNDYSKLNSEETEIEDQYNPSVLSLILPNKNLDEDNSSTNSKHSRKIDSLESSEVWVSLDSDTQIPNTT